MFPEGFERRAPGADDLAPGRDSAAAGQHSDDLGDREEAEGHDGQGEPVEKIGLAEGEAVVRRGRGRADGAQEQAEAAGQHADREILADHAGGEVQADQSEHQQLGGSQGEHDRAGDGNGERQRDGADDPAEHGGEEAQAERRGGLAAPGHGMAFDGGRRGGRRARGAEQHRGDRIGGIDRGDRAEQQGEAAVAVEEEDEGQHDGDGRDTAEAGQHAEDHAGHHAGEQRQQAHGLEEFAQGRESVFHRRVPPGEKAAAPGRHRHRHGSVARTGRRTSPSEARSGRRAPRPTASGQRAGGLRRWLARSCRSHRRPPRIHPGTPGRR